MIFGSIDGRIVKNGKILLFRIKRISSKLKGGGYDQLRKTCASKLRMSCTLHVMKFVLFKSYHVKTVKKQLDKLFFEKEIEDVRSSIF